MRRWALGLILLLGAAPAAADDPFAGIAGRPLSDFTVTRPGIVIAEPAARREELGRLGADRAEAWCKVPVSRSKRMLKPITDLQGKARYGGTDKTVTDFDWSVTHLSAAAFGAGDRTAAKDLRALLVNWSRVGAMTRIRNDRKGSNHNVLFGLKRSLNTLIPAWSMFRDDPVLEPNKRAEIEAWIGQLVALADVNTGTEKSRDKARNCPGNENNSNCNNHRYLRDSMNAMWGALSGDDARFQKGVERYVVALAQMRPDGSLPLETQRGARALWYQRHGVTNLVAIAEVAANQGYDLYGLKGPQGADLHTAVDFLMRGIADPSLVLDYAKANYRPGPSNNWREQDLGFLIPRGRNRYMAWAEPYMRRFPQHPNTQALRNLVHEGIALVDQRPLAARIAGGNTTCWWTLD